MHRYVAACKWELDAFTRLLVIKNSFIHAIKLAIQTTVEAMNEFAHFIKGACSHSLKSRGCFSARDWAG